MFAIENVRNVHQVLLVYYVAEDYLGVVHKSAIRRLLPKHFWERHEKHERMISLSTHHPIRFRVDVADGGRMSSATSFALPESLGRKTESCDAEKVRAVIAIIFAHEALDLSLCGDPGRPGALLLLADLLSNIYQQLGRINDLCDAMSLLPRCTGSFAICLNRNSLQPICSHFIVPLNTSSDLNDAISLSRDALTLCPRDACTGHCALTNFLVVSPLGTSNWEISMT